MGGGGQIDVNRLNVSVPSYLQGIEEIDRLRRLRREHSSNASFEGLTYAPASSGLDSNVSLDQLLGEFSVLGDGDGQIDVDRVNVSMPSYMQDIEEIDRLMAETSNNIFTEGFVLDTGTSTTGTTEQSFRSGSL